ncbi:hypothetical protein SERLA73DRAFT_74899 [Serpula lacrymans var. lacrymans S7.3]|uniref:Uncharacterized protein n=2 Tax=Serpula lacrymans var. lacrymans TaxID=341189 RepID=F8Q1Y6_SERL3|nr:uncharacterized protein SERLADRAFT_439567 [Serpula lacrymans var. lacrymans S7.9]EGN97197.1 hypothetical protein SERLA73DRAFT_74899 [Serpula lacrymans var. lacrymans S7.3]EGO22803.1 hypothetical protein SERLADRAFT_439567 [Serpula lacrymans var. lacrymans S7.9]
MIDDNSDLEIPQVSRSPQPVAHKKSNLPSSSSNSAPPEEYKYYFLLELWQPDQDNRIYNIRVNNSVDLFEELQQSLKAGTFLYPTPLPPQNEIRFNDGFESNFGIKLPSEEIPLLSSSTGLCTGTKVSLDNPYCPWPSKAHFLSALLFGSARIPFSDVQKHAILNWAKELGAQNVPSLYSIKKCSKRVSELLGNITDGVTSQLGNIFYMNDIGKAIAKDYANPLTRFAMQDYPEDGGSGMSEVFNGEKLLTQMQSPPAARVLDKIYFINKLLQENLGRYFIPEQFFLASYPSTDNNAPTDKELYALGCPVKRTEAGFIVNDEKEIIPTSAFIRLFKDILLHEGELSCRLMESSKKYAELMPHPLCQKANGQIVYSVPLTIFMDDVSGNISKQWNKHHTIYMSNANLPRELLKKEFFVCFVSSSPHAAPMELMRVMKDPICRNWIIAWDCRDEQEVMLIPYGLFIAGDNLMQAEECSHAGLGCNYFCQICKVGGMNKYKKSEAGYNSLFVPGALHTPEKTAEKICCQFDSPFKSGATEKIKWSKWGKKLRKQEAGQRVVPEVEIQASLEKEFEELMQGLKYKDVINPLLGMEGLDIHMDTPTEILHTVLLGVVKYVWFQTIFLLEKNKLLDIFQMRLESIKQHVMNCSTIFSGSCDTIKHIATGGYWYHTVNKTWVWGGSEVLGYMETHPHQAKLLGLPSCDSPEPGTGIILKIGGKKDTITWKKSRCAAVLLNIKERPGLTLYRGKSLIIKVGNNVSVDNHIIFYHPVENKERTRSIRTKAIIRHKNTSRYLLNSFSIHNYEHIYMALPESLRSTPLRITNIEEVQKVAVQQMENTKSANSPSEAAENVENGTSEAVENTENGTANTNNLQLAFDHQPNKPKIARKQHKKSPSQVFASSLQPGTSFGPFPSTLRTPSQALHSSAFISSSQPGLSSVHLQPHQPPPGPYPSTSHMPSQALFPPVPPQPCYSPALFQAHYSPTLSQVQYSPVPSQARCSPTPSQIQYSLTQSQALYSPIPSQAQHSPVFIPLLQPGLSSVHLQPL